MTQKEQNETARMINGVIITFVLTAALIGLMMFIGATVTPFHVIAATLGCAITAYIALRPSKDDVK